MALRLFAVSDDFFTDRLCRRYGVIFFLAVAAIIAASLSRDGACQCWCPAYFTRNHEEYTNSECCYSGTLYTAHSSSVKAPPLIMWERQQYASGKVKHLPALLVAQIFVFLIPRGFWNLMGYLSGFRTGNVVKAADDVTKQANNRDYSSLATLVTSYLEKPFPFLAQFNLPIGGYTLTVQYMLSKIGYFLSCVVQLVILSKYFEFNFQAAVLRGSFSRNTTYSENNSTFWLAQELFPDTVFCQFQIRQMGNVHPHIVMCKLSGNNLVERAVLAIHIWLWCACAALIASTGAWIVRIVCYAVAPLSYRMARLGVLLGRPLSAESARRDKTLQRFSALLLKPDGALILEILEDNVSINAACALARAAWEQYAPPAHAIHAPHPAPSYPADTQDGDCVTHETTFGATCLGPSHEAQDHTTPLMQKDK